jgi:hypothetical protein
LRPHIWLEIFNIYKGIKIESRFKSQNMHALCVKTKSIKINILNMYFS